MADYIEYRGTKYRVNASGKDHAGSAVTHLWVERVAELPPEPPVGSVYADDAGRPWWRQGDLWFSSGPGAVGPGGAKWGWLLRRTSLRPMVLVPKGDSAVVFNGPFGEHAVAGLNYHGTPLDDTHGAHFYRGYSDMEAPVHGFFERLED